MTSFSSTRGPEPATSPPETAARPPESEPLLREELAAARMQLAEQERRTQLLLQGQENERRALAYALQDEAAQSLAAITLGLGAVERELDVGAARAQVAALRSGVADTLRALRELAIELRPPVLDELGLQPALRGLAGRVSARSGHQIVLETNGLDERLAPDLETTVYRLVDELLDVLGANSEIRIALDLAADGIRIVATPSDPSGELVLSPDMLDRIRARLDLGAGLLAVERNNRHKLVAHIPLHRS